MILADLIKGNKTAITLPPANANPAKVAKVDPVTAVFEPRLAGLATLALAAEIEPEAADINLAHWQAEIIKLADELSCKDPGGDCWQWLKDNRPNLWKDHLAADMAIDKVYQEQDAEKIGAAISRTRGTFTAMINAWKKRHDYKQPSLMAA